MADRKVSILLELVDKASREFDRIANGFQGTVKKMGSSFAGLVKDAELGSAAFVYAFQNFGKKAVQAASDAELFRKSIEFMTKGNIQATDRFIKQINDLALNTFFSIDQLEEFGKRLLGVTNDTDVTVKALKVLTDTVSATGGGYGELEGATRAFFQTFIKGKPSLEELNRQFTNASIPALRVLAEQLAAGTVELKGYSTTEKVTAGASDKLAKAFASASDKLPELQLRLSSTEKKLQAMKDAGKEGSAQWDSTSATLMSYQRQISQATGSIDAYSKANENAGKVISTHKKSVEEIMSDLQGIADLNVTGKDTALALLDALEIAYGGASQEMIQTFAGQMEKAGESLTLFFRSLMGINQDDSIREGSMFMHMRDALFQFNQVITPLIPKVGEMTDKFLSNKVAVMALAGGLIGMVIPALLAFISFAAPAIAVGVAFANIGLAVGVISQNFQQFLPILIGVGTALGVLALAKIPALIAGLGAVAISSGFAAGGLSAVVASALAFLGPLAPIAIGIGLITAAIAGWAIQNDIFLTKQQIINRETRNLAQARRDLTTATDELTNAENRTRGAMQGVTEAELSLERATKNVETAVRTYGEGSLEAREAIAAQDRAELSLEDAKIRVTEAAANEIEKQQEFMEQSKAVEEASDRQKEAVNRQRTAWDNISDSIGNAINKFKNWIGIGGAGDAGAPDAGRAFAGAAQHGMVVPGNPTQAVPILAHGGERIIPRSGVDVNPVSSGGSSGGGGTSINFYGPVAMDSEQRVQQLADQIIKKLGRQNELARFGVGF